MPPKKKSTPEQLATYEAFLTDASADPKPLAPDAANSDLGATPEKGTADSQLKDTPAKQPAKRSRGKTDLATASSRESVEDPQTVKKPKRDKSAPLQRSLTPRQLLVPEGGRKLLKLLSLNVAGLRAVLNNDDKAQKLKAAVERETPDILFLNEHKLQTDHIEESEAKLKALLKDYATMHWTCSTVKKGYSGVVVLIRHAADGEAAVISSPEAVVVAPGMGELGVGDPIVAEEGRIMTVDLPDVMVIATYVPNSGSDLQRLSYRVDRKADHCWDGKLAKYVRSLEESKKKPVVVIGDMNCCVQVQDIWNMHDRPDFPDVLARKPLADQYTGLKPLLSFAGLTPQERESFPKMLDEAGLVDTFRAIHPDASGVFTYFSQRFANNRPMNKGLRLDYVLASTSMCTHLGALGKESCAADLSVPRIHDSFVLDDLDMVADHCPVGCHIVL